jgi:aspartate aminotransferase
MIRLLSEIENVKINEPEGAFYIFPNMSKYIGKSYDNKIINSSDDLAMFLMEEGGVSTVSGSAFGADDYIRISYAASETELITACKSIKKSLKKLN